MESLVIKNVGMIYGYLQNSRNVYTKLFLKKSFIYAVFFNNAKFICKISNRNMMGYFGKVKGWKYEFFALLYSV